MASHAPILDVINHDDAAFNDHDVNKYEITRRLSDQISNGAIFSDLEQSLKLNIS